MLLLTLINDSSKNYVVEEVKEIVEHFKGKNVTLGISESLENEKQLVKIFCEEEDYNHKTLKIFNLYIANAIYKVVINQFCSSNIGKFITENYPFLKFDDIKIVKTMIEKSLKDEDEKIDDTVIYFMNRKNNIVEKIASCLEENKEINIEGLVTFRMREFREDLEGIVEKIVEKYMVEKEYNEFIKLLKYFVEVQESKLEEVHIMIDKNGDYIVKDEFGNDILNNLMDELYETKYTAKVTSEDLIISGLITTAPKKIIIHSLHNCRNKELLDTIKNVFNERVTYCDSCKQCEVLGNSIKV
ncbi:putative sporulation protein YtxC [Clostridium sp.]|uniref:putative sporulation protein YtxC n=1 Tax=Clostridium sp. TaxID=1506 RepID=UPI002FCA2F0C